MESVNIKLLAQRLSLSTAAVSKALHDSHDISKQTKEKVLALATELNYQPNPHASSLRRHKSKTIAVIIPEIANNFFTLAINGIESIAQANNYHVLIYLTHDDVEKEIALTRYLHGGRVDGVLISVSGTTVDHAHLYQLEENGLPVVFFDRVCEPFNTARITTNDCESGYLATQHLLERGCRRVAHLALSQSISIGRKRRRGYEQALADQGLSVEGSLILECGNDEAYNEAAIERLLREQKPDGIFASIEQYALDVYKTCRALQLSIPEDVKVVCFSNNRTAAYLNPSLTTITQPAFDMGKQAAAMLFKALEKKSFKLKDESIVIRSTLIERESTR